jgi:hypothetical protein
MAVWDALFFHSGTSEANDGMGHHLHRLKIWFDLDQRVLHSASLAMHACYWQVLRMASYVEAPSHACRRQVLHMVSLVEASILACCCWIQDNVTLIGL